MTELYLGVAICMGMSNVAEFARSCELIRAGLRDGAVIPVWLVRPTVDALGLANAFLLPTELLY